MEQKPISLNEIYNLLLELKLKMNKMDQYLEDLEFARRTEEAYQRHESGEFKQIDEKKFLKELDKW
ncbi:MAG: hypothetical protein KKD18_04530 [Nanoarchaeota archaeon]|nr:hypothetical protein [Nanoarchaeota archaeon]